MRSSLLTSFLLLVALEACSEKESSNLSPGAGTGGARNNPATGGAHTSNLGGAPMTGGSSSGGLGGTVATGGNHSTGGVGGAPPANTGGTAITGGAAGAGTGGSPWGSQICPPGPFPENPLPSQNLTAQVRCMDLTFTEGPVWLGNEGPLLFSNFQHGNASSNFNGDILEWGGSGCPIFAPNVGTNGLALDREGKLIGASHLTQNLITIDLTTKEVTEIPTNHENKTFSSPNDLTVHSNGTIYFTDPAWQLGNRQAELPQAAYYRTSDGTAHLIEELNRPNGITLSPDEGRLYISIPGTIRVYDLSSEGVPSNGRDFIDDRGSDGMVVDCAGNLYLTDSGAVFVYSPEGQVLGSVQSPSSTNVAFGGPDRKTLYVTGGKELRSVDLLIPGYPY